ncbi:MAG: response regulator [Pseudomonadota bacterium]|jgi:CRP-like cAMP-binding protein/CheY-like chemotaxis protein
MTTKVLIAEDEALVALDISHELESAGYTVVGQVASGKDAIAKTGELRPDVVLLDITMPGEIDGIQAADEIGKRFGTPTIFVTAHSDEGTLQRAKLSRPSGYVMKPFEPNELRANIEIALHKFKTKEAYEEEIDLPIVPEPAEGLDNVLVADQYKYEGVRAITILEGVPTREINDLAKTAVIQDVNAGEYLSMDGERPDFGFMVLSGRLAVIKSTPHGKELTLDLLIPGDCSGILRALEPNELDTSIRGQTDAKLLAIPTSQLKMIAEKYPVVYRHTVTELMRRLRRTNDLALGLAHSRVESRIVAALLALAPRFGRPTTSEDQTRIFLTRKELADLTGTTPETAIRVTKNLEREGLLDLTKPGVIKILSLKQLRGVIE